MPWLGSARRSSQSNEHGLELGRRADEPPRAHVLCACLTRHHPSPRMDSLHTNFRSELATGLVAEGETVMVDGASSLFEDLGVAIFNRKADFSKHDAVWFDDDHNFEQAMKTLLEVKDKLLRIDSRVTMMSVELSKAEVAEYVPALTLLRPSSTLPALCDPGNLSEQRF